MLLCTSVISFSKTGISSVRIFWDLSLVALDSMINVLISAAFFFFSASFTFWSAVSISLLEILFRSSFLFFAVWSCPCKSFLFLPFSEVVFSLSFSTRYILYLADAWLQDLLNCSVMTKSAILMFSAMMKLWITLTAVRLFSWRLGTSTSLLTEKPLSTAACPWESVSNNCTVSQRCWKSSFPCSLSQKKESSLSSPALKDENSAEWFFLPSDRNFLYVWASSLLPQQSSTSVQAICSLFTGTSLLHSLDLRSSVWDPNTPNSSKAVLQWAFLLDFHHKRN